jgi:hypothetical protein
MIDIENNPIEEKAKTVAQIDAIREQERRNNGGKMEASNSSGDGKTIKVDDGKYNVDKNEMNETNLRGDFGVL